MGDEAIREQVAKCSRIMTMKALIGLYGHLSAYDPQTGRIYLTPGAGSDRANVRAEDIWVLSKTGEVLEGSGRIAAEWPIHTAIHSTRADALAVAHVHAPFTTVFAIAEREFRPVTLTGAVLLGDGVPLFNELGLVVAPEQGQRLAAAIGSHRALLMRGHGGVIAGGSLEEVLHAALALEDNCLKAWQAAALGPVRWFSDEECQAVNQSKRPPSFGGVAWEYYSRVESSWDRQPTTTDNPLG
ncbi:MAG TPA: class II aldolase/adducin family protein [Chloroflexota bacterium]|nr:class II aldolase/adducin family protein [Chloroflexota bacterium]